MLANKAKYLRYSEDHYEDYLVQLTSHIRSNDDADLLLDGLLPNPVIETYVDKAEARTSMTQFYAWFGDPWPPTKDDWLYQPSQTLALVLERLRTGGTPEAEASGREAFNAEALQNLATEEFKKGCLKWRKAQKYIYSTVIAGDVG